MLKNERAVRTDFDSLLVTIAEKVKKYYSEGKE